MGQKKQNPSLPHPLQESRRAERPGWAGAQCPVQCPVLELWWPLRPPAGAGRPVQGLGAGRQAGCSRQEGVHPSFLPLFKDSFSLA